MKKCSIYVKNGTLEPSSYYRITQYISELKCECVVRNMLTDKEYEKNMGMNGTILKKIYQLFLLIKIYFRSVVFLRKDIKNKVDVVIVQRTLVPRLSFSLIDKLFCKMADDTRFLWDFDDNIVQSAEISKRTANLFMKKAYAIIVTHNYLKEVIDSDYQDKVYCLPTTDSTIKYEENQKEYLEKLFADEIKILWLGTSSNLVFLRDVIVALDEAAEKLQNNRKKLVLTVVCNFPLIVDTDYLKVVNKKWTREVANSELLSNHIGIMPLRDNYYTKGKGAFKLIQYMAAGLPVIASPVGFNVETVADCGFLADSDIEWINAILKLSSDFELWKQYATASRLRFIEKFNPVNSVKLYNSLIEAK